jgi:hypothetical protein
VNATARVNERASPVKKSKIEKNAVRHENKSISVSKINISIFLLHLRVFFTYDSSKKISVGKEQQIQSRKDRDIYNNDSGTGS